MENCNEDVIIVVLALLFVNSAFGQEEQRSVLQSGRPNLTDGPFVVTEGVLQLELGWTYSEHGNGSDVDSHQFPQTLFRYGLQTNLELRVGWNGYSFVDVADETDEIASDMFVGLKWHLSSQTDNLPADERDENERDWHDDEDDWGDWDEDEELEEAASAA